MTAGSERDRESFIRFQVSRVAFSQVAVLTLAHLAKRVTGKEEYDDIKLLLIAVVLLDRPYITPSSN